MTKTVRTQPAPAWGMVRAMAFSVRNSAIPATAATRKGRRLLNGAVGADWLLLLARTGALAQGSVERWAAAHSLGDRPRHWTRYRRRRARVRVPSLGLRVPGAAGRAARRGAERLFRIGNGLLLGYFPGFNGIYWDNPSVYERDRGLFRKYIPSSARWRKPDGGRFPGLSRRTRRSSSKGSTTGSATSSISRPRTRAPRRGRSSSRCSPRRSGSRARPSRSRSSSAGGLSLSPAQTLTTASRIRWRPARLSCTRSGRPGPAHPSADPLAGSSREAEWALRELE